MARIAETDDGKREPNGDEFGPTRDWSGANGNSRAASINETVETLERESVPGRHIRGWRAAMVQSLCGWSHCRTCRVSER